MLMMLAVTPMLLPNAFDASAYASVDDANADAKMPNSTCHLVGAYAMVMMPTLLPLLVMMQLMLVLMQ